MNFGNEDFWYDQKRFWTLQLISEHGNICWHHGVRLSTPSFVITESKTHFGEWNETLRRISISEHLIKNHSWDTVVQVLRHEMAHQMVSELLFSQEGHGPNFKIACGRLGVASRFQGSQGDLKEGFEKDASDEKLPSRYDEIASKIDKLLSLAKSDNENEALSAMQKARELQQKYNISQQENLKDEDFSYKILELKKKRVTLQQSIIGSILQNHYMVNVVYSSLYDASVGEVYKTIELLGTKENLISAEYIFYFLSQKIEQLWETHRREHGSEHRYKRSYQVGLLHGFRKKLENLERQSENFTKGLMVVHDKLVKEFTRTRFPRLQSVSHSRSGLWSGSYSKGCSDGASIVINKGVESRSTTRGGLLAERG